MYRMNFLILHRGFAFPCFEFEENMKRTTALLLIFALTSVLSLSGCASLRRPPEKPRTMAETEADTNADADSDSGSTSRDAYEEQTHSMRKTIDDARPSKGKPRGFQYGGMSSEAQEIEDHLYGM